MTRDVRNNLIIAALAVSLVAHLGAMFWAKPHVMTRVAEGIARIARRGPMRVQEASERPDPVTIDVMRDEAAEKPAPEAAGAVAVLPSGETVFPSAPAGVVTPEVAMSAVLDGLAPEAAAPRVVEAPVGEVCPPAEPKMMFDRPAIRDATGSEVVSVIISRDAPSAPMFEAPVFAPVGNLASGAVSFDRSDGPASGSFTPLVEVMPEIDANVVEREKRAVRELMASGRSRDLCAVVDAALAVRSEGGYTYFRATLRAKSGLGSVPKDVVVLIDASGSIGHDRLSSCCRAAKEILRTAMNTGDRFNLVAFRDRFSYAFRIWQPCEAKSYAEADAWMARLAAHGRTDVFATIASVLTLPRDPKRPLIALVVTDGEANAGVSETAAILSQFTALNDGLVSVYMYGVKEAANRELIDVLTHGNRGESLVFDGWRWNAGEDIGVFSERFRDPLVTDLRLVFPAASGVEAYPVLLKNLYRGNAVEIVGRVRGAPAEIAFSLRGIAGEAAYDGFFRLPTASAKDEAALPAVWRAERNLDARLRPY